MSRLDIFKRPPRDEDEGATTVSSVNMEEGGTVGRVPSSTHLGNIVLTPEELTKLPPNDIMGCTKGLGFL